VRYVGGYVTGVNKLRQKTEDKSTTGTQQAQKQKGRRGVDI
jgi:hypothetical protein